MTNENKKNKNINNTKYKHNVDDHNDNHNNLFMITVIGFKIRSLIG